ncbi:MULTISPECIES: hypothetical protein [Prauserella]|uniref:hypothetical protein n=1 Tax=Prauserella TaxID=142577 RepID=UPI0018F62CCA|nr:MULTISPECIES: hypothetical protein [Prauserella]
MVQETGKRSPGLSKLAIFGLALLAVPRVVAHDLDLVGPAVNALLVWVPLVIWVTVVLVRRVENPFLTLLAVGLVYGILLAIGHQVFWEESFDDPPALGGNLAGVLSPGTETVVLRGFAFLSSVVTGTAVGAATGAVAWLLSRLRRS